MKKRTLTLCIVCILCIFGILLLAGYKHKGHNHELEEGNPNYDASTYLTGKYYVQINFWDHDPIILELDADAAPATVTNFMNLVQGCFYDNLTFHRIINGFMMQGGDPEGTGLGGSEYTVPGEFAANGYNNPISHVRGTVSMARAEDYDSASSQFFIVQQDSTALDGNYAAFGKVLFGMDVIDYICSTTPVIDSDGTVEAAYQPVIESVYEVGEDLINILKQQELANLPDPTANITFTPISSIEGLTVKETWNIHDDGDNYLLFSSEGLLSLGIYETNSSMEYDTSSPLAFIENLDANEYLSVKMSIPDADLPSFIIVTEEPSGAIGQYLICYDEYFGGAYLVTVTY